MALRIRGARKTDAGLIAEFIRALAKYERLSREVVVNDSLLKKHLFGPEPAAEVLIAEWNGAPAGFALFFGNFSTFLGRPGIHLEDLFVKQEHRGRGVGKALLRHLARLAVKRGCGRLEWSVLDWNAPAIKFYRKIGAVPMKGWTVQRLTGGRLSRFARGA
jgi:GNAT superfamily N-acetyltransferase